MKCVIILSRSEGEIVFSALHSAGGGDAHTLQTFKTHMAVNTFSTVGYRIFNVCGKMHISAFLLVAVHRRLQGVL